ncbi:hypothetical protein BpHYR1_023628 [Brachionus plicatilis]|uniref:Uncharacterized protein n=1 Tax=Brachionus plicatilis TaxID=10195 RepID=A0A3M7PL21_BRAPC|nr:hypothetical protein BpHYR1_023628 [Brachionus plicatilis]
MKTTAQEPTTSKRARDEEPVSTSPKRQKTQILRHCILNANLTSEDTVLELFENVRIIGVDKESFTDKRHYHVLGIPKLFKRAARDLSKITLEQMGISHHLARQAFHSMHYGEIRDFNHWENLISYIEKKKSIAIRSSGLRYPTETLSARETPLSGQKQRTVGGEMDREESAPRRSGVRRIRGDRSRGRINRLRKIKYFIPLSVSHLPERPFSAKIPIHYKMIFNIRKTELVISQNLDF